MDKVILNEVGLSKNEIDVYLALIDLGLSSAQQISQKSGVHRSNTYEALERLIKKGLVSFVIKNNSKQFQASDVNNLMKLVKEKEYRLKNLLPELELRKKLASPTGSVSMFFGIKAFEQILENFLSYNEDILIFGIPKTAYLKLKYFLPGFHKRRLAKKIWKKHIYNYNAMDRINYLNSMPYTEARYLPSEFNSNVETNICGDEVVIVGWSEPPWLVQIKNKEIAETYRKYFYLLWKDAKK